MARNKTLRNLDHITPRIIIDSIFRGVKTKAQRRQLKEDIDLVFGTAINTLSEYNDTVFMVSGLGTFYKSQFQKKIVGQAQKHAKVKTKEKSRLCTTLRFVPATATLNMLKEKHEEQHTEENTDETRI